MRCFTAFAAAAFLVDSVASTAWLSTPSRAERRNHNSPDSKGFVTARNGQLLLDGRPYRYFATNAYWLMHLSDANINLTMQSIAAANISVLRTWAFNDVFEIPHNGAWFQAFNPNGTVTINRGVNGLQRLDRIFELAKENGLKVQLALTNNWNPTNLTVEPLIIKRDNTTSNVTHPRGYLSNDYGGMDAYVRAHGLKHHDQFYSNQTIIDAFTKYLNEIVPRYKNNTDLVAWELANDPRCNSTLPHSGACEARNVTRWHDILSRTVKQLDPNHLVTSGSHGFFCTDCPKLFPLRPAPQASPAPGQRKRATGPLTTKKLLAQRRAKAKRNEEVAKKRWAGAAEKRSAGEKTRWTYRGKPRDMTHGKRQTQAIGPAFDGSHGVDSEDIANIPGIAFTTFQMFPDQNVYGPLDPNLDSFNNTLQTGIEWIQHQASTAVTSGKPLAVTGFGLVTQENLPFFTPFNASQPFISTNASSTQAELPTPTGLGEGLEQGQLPVTDAQQRIAYEAWIQAAIDSAVTGITQYQWGLQNLLPTSPPSDAATQAFVPAIDPTTQQQMTPNDGYQVNPTVQAVVQQGAINQQITNV